MSLSGVERSLLESGKIFESTVSRRENLIRESREVIALSARSIVSIHNSRLEEAKKLQEEAVQILEALRKDAAADLVRYLIPPETEVVECSMILAISTGSKFPSARQLKVGPASYILGLLDSIGEMKRMVYDKIRSSEYEAAEKIFKIMEKLYLLLAPFSIYDHVAPGSKRKVDVARILIEETRGLITEESRRRELTESVSRLSSQLSAYRAR